MPHFCGIGTKICHAFGIKDQKFERKNEISDEKAYIFVSHELPVKKVSELTHVLF